MLDTEEEEEEEEEEDEEEAEEEEEALVDFPACSCTLGSGFQLGRLRDEAVGIWSCPTREAPQTAGSTMRRLSSSIVVLFEWRLSRCDAKVSVLDIAKRSACSRQGASSRAAYYRRKQNEEEGLPQPLLGFIS